MGFVARKTWTMADAVRCRPAFERLLRAIEHEPAIRTRRQRGPGNQATAAGKTFAWSTVCGLIARGLAEDGGGAVHLTERGRDVLRELRSR